MAPEVKAQLEPVLKADYMSSDETASENSSENSDGENSTQQLNQRKRLRKHPVTWRSAEFEDYILSIDRKLARRRTERGKAMVLETVIGRDSPRSAPIDCPEWAKTVFND